MEQQDYSQKSYGTAVALAGIFGMLGIHHFYLGNILHGLFDLCLSIVGFTLIAIAASPALILLGVLMLVIDFFHTIYVFYKLIVGEWHDSLGKLVTFKKSESLEGIFK